MSFREKASGHLSPSLEKRMDEAVAVRKWGYAAKRLAGA